MLSRSLHGVRRIHGKHSISHPQSLFRRPLFRSSSSELPSRLRTALSASVLLVAGTFFTVYYLDSRSSLHRYVVTPIIRNLFDAETGHKVAVRALRSGFTPRDTVDDDESLKVVLWGEEISNPIGLAAGFDKNGEAIDGLFNLGFGWVEIGSVTPEPQPGNPTPRVFHLLSDSALINRYGFPSQGAVSVLAELRARWFEYREVVSRRTHDIIDAVYPNDTDRTRASLKEGRILAVNLGKNKTSPVDSIEDFLKGIRSFGPWADVLVINVSSPNTPGLRGLQSKGSLEQLIAATAAEKEKLTGRKPRLVLKIAPDLDARQLDDVASAIGNTPGIDGVIVSNTTIQRPPDLISENRVEVGGLSGPPLFPISLQMVKKLRTLLPASIPIIGCGGISSGAEAIEFAKAGAACVQIYTSFGYGGVGTARRIKDEAVEELRKMGQTWEQVSQGAVERLSAQKVVSPPQIKAVEESDIQALIREAERIKRLLDSVELAL